MLVFSILGLIAIIIVVAFVCLGMGKLVSCFAEKIDKKLDERLDQRNK